MSRRCDECGRAGQERGSASLRGAIGLASLIRAPVRVGSLTQAVLLSTLAHAGAVFCTYSLAESAVEPLREGALATVDVDVMLLGVKPTELEAGVASYSFAVRRGEASRRRGMETADGPQAMKNDAVGARIQARAHPVRSWPPTSHGLRERLDERGPCAGLAPMDPAVEGADASEDPPSLRENARRSRGRTSDMNEPCLRSRTDETAGIARVGSTEGNHSQQGTSASQSPQAGRSKYRGGSFPAPGRVAWEQIRKAIQQRVAYPRLARRMRWQGKVVVGFDIGPNGGVEDIRVLRSSGHTALDKSALAAVAHAAPLPVLGKRLRIELPLVFVLH
jgi:protein TonB